MKQVDIVVFLGLALVFLVQVDLTSSEDAVPGEKAYADGSMCGYCDYCKFCNLCERDCPCETIAERPNCKMCKYCHYCYLCSSVCDTVCTPGGLLDTLSASIVNSLPSYNKKEVDSDIDSVKNWIDAQKDEL